MEGDSQYNTWRKTVAQYVYVVSESHIIQTPTTTAAQVGGENEVYLFCITAYLTTANTRLKFQWCLC
jgi:hypothetical protein